MLCLVCLLFIISTSAIDCLGRFVSEMTYYVSSGTLNLTKPKPKGPHVVVYRCKRTTQMRKGAMQVKGRVKMKGSTEVSEL